MSLLPNRNNFPPAAGDATVAWAERGPGHVCDRNFRHSSCRLFSHFAHIIMRRFHLFRRITIHIAIKMLCGRLIAQALATFKLCRLTAFPSSLKYSPPMHQRWFPLGQAVRVALALRLGGPSMISSVTVCASSHSLRIYYQRLSVSHMLCVVMAKRSDHFLKDAF